MSRPIQGTAFFSTPVWQHTQPRRRRSSTSSSASSSSSSSSSSASSHLSAPDDTQPTPPPPISTGALVARDESPPVSHSTGDDPFHRPRILRRGRHVKLPRELLANHQLVPIPGATEGVWSLRTKHLGVMTTVLYRSLLTRDFVRAERAFGCLIRSKNVDVRRNLWGIGVDLLLRRKKSGLKDASEFLERLILFFPYRPRFHSNHPALGLKRGKKKAGLVKPRDSALEFQPALFNLLIESSGWQDVLRRKEQRQSMEDAEEVEAGAEGEVEVDEEGITPEKIKERLAVLMLTPPWSDMTVLLCLRGMVCLWVADVAEEEGEDDRELFKALREEAKGYFEMVKEKGGTLPEGIEDALQVEEEGDEDVDMVDT